MNNFHTHADLHEVDLRARTLRAQFLKSLFTWRRRG